MNFLKTQQQQPQSATKQVEEKPQQFIKPIEEIKKDTQSNPAVTNGKIDFFGLTTSKTTPDLFKSSPNKQSSPFSFAPATDAKPSFFGNLVQQFSSTPLAMPKSQSLPFTSLTKTDDVEGEGEEDNANPEEYEPQVDFKPLVALKEVEVKTGEEDEEVLFKERCKLYRFSPETKEWKEKGVGEIKILRHKETNAHRVLMRRDQVLKLCANHRILPDIKLEIANEKQVRWSANDYSENEAKYEILLAKFKSEDEAKRFKNGFEKAQAQYIVSPMKPVVQSLSQVNLTNGKPSLSESFKIESGTWSCTQCLVSDNN